MKPGDDLTAEALEPLLGERALRSHRVLLSTASSAAEWAGSGAPDGAVVVADSQISPRGRAGRPWRVAPGRGLGFALVLRPQLVADREGWLYTVVLTALADVCGDGVTIEWPDEVRRGGEMVAGAGIDVRLGARGVKWAVVNMLLPDAEPPRGELLAATVGTIEKRLVSPADAVLEDYTRRCSTLGRSVQVRLLGGTMRFEGTATSTQEEGALVLETSDGRMLPIRPQDVRTIAGA
jgi:BirA family transcriptional regulator, biotin operon repressor / biotin---[acetyl-CoA-carboxylase] ligase